MLFIFALSAATITQLTFPHLRILLELLLRHPLDALRDPVLALVQNVLGEIDQGHVVAGLGGDLGGKGGNVCHGHARGS